MAIDFFIHYWHIVYEGIMVMFSAFFNGTLDVQRWNNGVITLLSKVSGAIKINNMDSFVFLEACTMVPH
jgi:hypothetical protein